MEETFSTCEEFIYFVFFISDDIFEVYTMSFQTFFRMGTFIDSTRMKL